jgi:hypothetical protein
MLDILSIINSFNSGNVTRQDGEFLHQKVMYRYAAYVIGGVVPTFRIDIRRSHETRTAVETNNV